MKNVLPIRLFVAWLCAQFLLASCWNLRALQIDVTQPPYSASPSLSDNGGIFVSAINAILAAGGGTLYIPAGNYKFTTPIVINGTSKQGSLIIKGDGPHMWNETNGTDLIWLGAGSTDAITVNGGSNSPHFVLRDLALSGNVPSQITYNDGNHNGLTFVSTMYSVVENVLVEGFQNDGIYLNGSSYCIIQNTGTFYCGVGVDCLAASGCSLINVSAQQDNAAGFRNPPCLIGCIIEGNQYNGVVYNEHGGKYSIRDCWFEGNAQNAAQIQECADIWGDDFTGSNGGPSISLSLDGRNIFNNNGSFTTAPYRYLMGGFYTLIKNGATSFMSYSPMDPHYRAMVDLKATILQDCSSEQYLYNLTWLTSSNSNNSYLSWNVAQAIVTNPN